MSLQASIRPLRVRFKAAIGQIVAYDCFPAFSARVRRCVAHPLGYLVLAALLALACGFLLHRQALALSGGVGVVIALGVAWPWLTQRGLRGAVGFRQQRGVEGVAAGAWLRVENRPPWPVWGLNLLRWHDPVDATVSLATVPGRRSAIVNWDFIAPERGVYPRERPVLATAFPFGLWQARREVTVESSLLVWPRTFPVGPPPAAEGGEQIDGCVACTRVGGGGDIVGLRPYRRGDSPRRIHWAQTARYDRLIVCERQTRVRPVVQLILDVDPRVHVGTGPDGSREWSVRIVASLARGWLEAGAQVGAAWAGANFPAAGAPVHSRHLLDGLARLGNDTPLSLPELLTSAAARTTPGCVQVVVTTDLALGASARSWSLAGRRRWIVLRTSGFRATEDDADEVQPVLPVKPWLSVDGPANVASLLRHIGEEARHA